MLPTDVSWGLSWRVMVFLLQLCGLFPFRVSATDAPPVFSLSLALWSVFLSFITFLVHIIGYQQIHPKYGISNVATSIFVYAVLALLIGMMLSNVILVVTSNSLASLLHHLSLFKDTSPPPTPRWRYNPKTLALTVILLMFVILFSWNSYYSLGVTSLPLKLLILPTSLVGLVSFLVPTEVPSKIFGTLVHHLVAATETAVAKVSFLLNTDDPFKCEDNVKTAKEVLDDLEAVIREVEVQRGKAAHHFLLVISIFLLSGVMLAITSPYVMSSNSVHGGESLTALILGFYIMGRLCHMGQVFVNQISVAEDLLKDLRVKCQPHTIKKKVSEVLSSLSPMRTFDMCGCYTLGYSQFLVFMNTVLTYLVIIMQVNDTEERHPDPQGVPVTKNLPGYSHILQPAK